MQSWQAVCSIHDHGDERYTYLVSVLRALVGWREDFEADSGGFVTLMFGAWTSGSGDFFEGCQGSVRWVAAIELARLQCTRERRLLGWRTGCAPMLCQVTVTYITNHQLVSPQPAPRPRFLVPLHRCSILLFLHSLIDAQAEVPSLLPRMASLSRRLFPRPRYLPRT